MGIKKRLLLVGGGGHCSSVLDSVLSLSLYDEVGVIDYDKSASSLGVPMVGDDEDLPDLKNRGWTDAFVSLGSIGKTDVRRRLFEKLKEIGFAMPSIVDPSSIVSKSAFLEEGVYVGKKAVINTGAKIGKCAIINTGSIIEHDCRVGDFVHISPGSVVCGQVFVGDDSHIGANTVVRQGINIGNHTMIGAGSVVVKDIADNVTAFGNSCRVVE